MSNSDLPWYKQYNCSILLFASSKRFEEDKQQSSKAL